MKKYEFLEHTADAKFRAYGRTLEGAFKNAALATFAIMTDITKIKPKIEQVIEVTSRNKEALLYDFLAELLFLMDTEGFLLGKVKSLKITHNLTYSLKAVVLGDNADNYEVFTAIKAVTYNDMFIKEEENKVTIQVVHDL
ncbi:archease [Candidatus Woesearchaeota archaeon]|nr:MAG: archease [Candidatus Woesearchaeota archaeon]